MIIEMQTSVVGELFSYHAGRQYETPGEIAEDRAREFLSLGHASLITPPVEAATLRQAEQPKQQQRGPRREAR